MAMMKTTRLFSVLVVAAACSMSISSARASTTVHLRGTVHGVEQRVFSNPDAGMRYTWLGQGKIAPLGRTSATARERAVGFIRSGHPVGLLTLWTPGGTIELRITYARTVGFAPIPSRGHYRITGGTGTFVGATGSGKVRRVAMPCSVSAACAFSVKFTFR